MAGRDADGKARERRRGARRARPARLRRRQGQHPVGARVARACACRSSRRGPDPRRSAKALADVRPGRRSRRAVHAERRRRRHVHVHGRQGCEADRGERSRARVRRPGCDERRPSKVDGPERHGHHQEAADQPARRGRAPRSRSTRARSVNDVSITTVGPTWGERGEPQGRCRRSLLLPPARGVPVDPVRVEDGRVRDHRRGPRHHLHDRRVHAVPVPGDTRHRHRLPHDSRFLALRHRRRVRQDRGEPEVAHRDRPHRPTARWWTGRSTRC